MFSWHFASSYLGTSQTTQCKLMSWLLWCASSPRSNFSSVTSQLFFNSFSWTVWLWICPNVLCLVSSLFCVFGLVLLWDWAWVSWGIKTARGTQDACTHVFAKQLSDHHVICEVRTGLEVRVYHFIFFNTHFPLAFYCSDTWNHSPQSSSRAACFYIPENSNNVLCHLNIHPFSKQFRNNNNKLDISLCETPQKCYSIQKTHHLFPTLFPTL